MPKRMLLIIRLKECAVPDDAVESMKRSAGRMPTRVVRKKISTPIGPEHKDKWTMRGYHRETTTKDTGASGSYVWEAGGTGGAARPTYLRRHLPWNTHCHTATDDHFSMIYLACGGTTSYSTSSLIYVTQSQIPPSESVQDLSAYRFLGKFLDRKKG
jgi:hypothetical protein